MSGWLAAAAAAARRTKAAEYEMKHILSVWRKWLNPLQRTCGVDLHPL